MAPVMAQPHCDGQAKCLTNRLDRPPLSDGRAEPARRSAGRQLLDCGLAFVRLLWRALLLPTKLPA